MFRYLAYVFTLVFLGLGGAQAQSIHTMPIGTEIEGIATIGRVQTPLPPGKWTLIGAAETWSNPLGGGQPRPFGHAYLALIERDRLVGFISAMAPGQTSDLVRSWDKQCERTDVYFIDAAPKYTIREQSCFFVAHAARTWTAGPNMGAGLEAAYTWLAEHPKVVKPSTMMLVRHSNVRANDFVEVEYNFSPEAYGFGPPRDRSAAGNDWHRDKLKNDPARDAFAQAVVAWAKDNQKRVLDGVIYRKAEAGAKLEFAAAAARRPQKTAAAGPSAAGHVTPIVGTRFVLKSGHFEVVKTEGMSVTTMNAAKSGATWSAGLLPLDSNAKFDRAAIESLFPLAVGKKAQFRQEAASSTNAWDQSLEVVRADSLQIDGKSYATFVIEGRTQAVGPGMNEFIRKRTLHYAPALGWLLKMQEEQLAGPPQRMNSWEVVRIVPPGG